MDDQEDEVSLALSKEKYYTKFPFQLKEIIYRKVIYIFK